MEDAYRELLWQSVAGANDRIGHALTELLKDPHHRDKVVAVLKLMGPAAAAVASALRPLLTDADVNVREAASAVVESLGADPTTSPGSHPDRAHRLHSEQLARALIWDMMNRRVSLKLALWRTIWGQLLLALMAAIAAPVVLRHDLLLGIRQDLVAIALLGLFGGTLSAFLSARDVVVEIPSYELIKRYTWLRMTLGAAGALVVCLVAMSLAAENVRNAVEARSFGFMSLGIAAGFSERLFVAAIEKAAENLHLTGTTKQAKGKQEKKAKG